MKYKTLITFSLIRDGEIDDEDQFVRNMIAAKMRGFINRLKFGAACGSEWDRDDRIQIGFAINYMPEDGEKFDPKKMTERVRSIMTNIRSDVRRAMLNKADLIFKLGTIDIED